MPQLDLTEIEAAVNDSSLKLPLVDREARISSD
jgi:hypothetical protein